MIFIRVCVFYFFNKAKRNINFSTDRYAKLEETTANFVQTILYVPLQRITPGEDTGGSITECRICFTINIDRNHPFFLLY